MTLKEKIMPEGVGYGPKMSVFSRQPQELRMPAEKAGMAAEDPSGKGRIMNRSEGAEVLIGKRPSKDQSGLTYENLRPRR